MAKEDNGGLLSKVVKFVRNPATNWSDLDQGESDEDNGNARQMLKELVERKKRNDFVRRREFDMLRKLRRRELAGGMPSPTQRPSFFQSSLPSKPVEREQTLKKIDEIEAQMSMQWWKTKHRDSTLNSSLFPTPDSGRSALAASAPPERPMLDPMESVGAQRASKAPAAAGARNSTDKRAGNPPFEASGSGFSASKYSAIEVGEIAGDPELEEASIRFANGDDKGAEAGLLDALGSNGQRSDKLDSWLALFDLYRATGQQARFDVAAIDFANQFQRSAPQWFSMPQMVDRLVGAQPKSAAAQAAHWACPPLLGVKAVGLLGGVASRIAPPWRLDWSRLSMIEPDALPGLTQLFNEWAERPVELRMTAAEHLEQILAAGAPSGDRSVAADWWHARMALLRVMYRMDEFEMAALNYCVTYEVSPPSWVNPLCIFKAMSSGGAERQERSAFISTLEESPTMPGESGASDFSATVMDSRQLPPVAVELSGSIIGDVSTTIERLDAKFEGADVLSISCTKLVRVDFAAAGTLLNWVSSRYAQGHQVHFSGVHRLIAGFFNVIGISEIAHITLRTD